MKSGRSVALAALVLAVALVLKLHYSNAGADDLAYVLAPTATLVQLVTGAAFVHESGAGYLSQELAILIAPSCAGVNFLVMAWCMLGCGAVAAKRGKLAWLAASAGLAYAATVIVNAARIVIGATLAGGTAESVWLTPDQLHRVLGVLVYLAALMALYSLVTATRKRLTV